MNVNPVSLILIARTLRLAIVNTKFGRFFWCVCVKQDNDFNDNVTIMFILFSMKLLSSVSIYVLMFVLYR